VVCRRVLVAERTPTDREALIGEEAHIAARSPGGARYGECALDIVDRYENLILLCRVDHKRVDDQWRHYTTSRLQQIKAEHEAWVEHSLGDVPASTHPWTSAGDQVVTGSIPWAPPHFVPPLMLPQLVDEPDGSAIFAVTGQRGVGKTQLAAAYARQRVADGWLVAWIEAETQESLSAGILELADAVGISSAELPFDVVTRRLRDYIRAAAMLSLVIFDDVTDVAVVSNYLPSPGHTQVVLTSTSRAVERLGQAVSVDIFDRATSVTFLRAATGLDDDLGAVELANELGGLPLALAQAAARICEVDHSYSLYLERLRSLPVDRYLTRVVGDHYQYGTAQAILLALEPVEAGDDLARLMLNALAAMSPDGAARQIFTDPAPDPVVIDDTLGKLYRASLLDFAGDARESVRIHRLVRRIVQERDLYAGSVTQTAEVAAHLLSRQTTDEHDAWRSRAWGAELVRHIDSVWDHVADHVSDEWVLARVLGLKNWSVNHLTAVHSFERAIAAGHATYDAFLAAFGNDHLGTQMSMSNLGNAYLSASYPSKAIPCFEQALALGRRVRGRVDPQTIEAMIGLASAYKAESRTDEAINLYEEALEAYRSLGDEVQAMGARLNLAGAFDSAGRTEEAILLYERALTDCVRLLGEDHPDTLLTINNLAAAYRSAGAIDESISMLERVTVASVEVLGADHPNTLKVMYNLADGYFKVGRFREAFVLLAENVEKCKEVFPGPNLITVASAALLIEVVAAIDTTEDTDRNNDKI